MVQFPEVHHLTGLIQEAHVGRNSSGLSEVLAIISKTKPANHTHLSGRYAQATTLALASEGASPLNTGYGAMSNVCLNLSAQL